MATEQMTRAFFEALNRRDFEWMTQQLDPDAQLFFPKTQPLLNRERILKFFKLLFRQYPELTFDIRRILQKDQQSVVHWTNQGLKRNGEPYQNEGVTWLETAGGRIRWISDFFKDTEKF